MIDLSGQRVLVTGASRGIGNAIARVLLDCGACVAAGYNRGDTALESLSRQGGKRVRAIQADLSTYEGVDSLWKAAVDWSGGLDAVVNNAAVMLKARPDDSLEDWRRDWRATMAVNVEAVADLSRYAIEHFLETGGGSIVNIASRAAFRGDLPDSFHYAASKGAVVALTRSIAKGYADKGIFAYTVAPGWVGTERIDRLLSRPGNEFMTREIPMGKAAAPKEVGNIVAFLLSGLAPNATGATVDINGASYFH